MYDVRFVYSNYKTFTVEVESKELDKFVACFSNNQPYFDELKELGFYVPRENLICAYMLKKKESHDVTNENGV